MPVVDVRKGNILESRSQTLVNTINTVGVMGKGIALDFKQRFPDMFEDYVLRCAAGEVKLGQPYLFRRLIPPWIVNFPTKEHWRSVSRLDAIVDGLVYLRENIELWEIESIAVPPLGCGNGQLEWRVVGPELFRHLNDLPIPVELYAPYEIADAEMSPLFLSQAIGGIGLRTEVTKLDSSLVLLAEIVDRLARSPYSWPIGHTRFQKLAYFATVAGIPTNLSFVEGSYGPFSESLKKALSKLVNNGILTERKTKGNLLLLNSGRTFNDARSRYKELIDHHEPAISRTVDLFRRLDSRGIELAATVHFVARALESGPNASKVDVAILEEVQRWKKRRRPPFRDEEVAEAITTLAMFGWIDVIKSGELPIDEDLFAYA
jgi:uncharacterized protein YwgA/O-acetyl-ADP-ribose deacetylase (regulator of RNase III)